VHEKWKPNYKKQAFFFFYFKSIGVIHLVLQTHQIK